MRVAAGARLPHLRHHHVSARAEAQDTRQEVDAGASRRPDAVGAAARVACAVGCRVGVDDWGHDVLIWLGLYVAV